MIKKIILLIILFIIIPYKNYPQDSTSYLHLNPQTHKVEVKYEKNKIINNSKKSHKYKRDQKQKNILDGNKQDKFEILVIIMSIIIGFPSVYTLISHIFKKENTEKK